MKKFVVIIVSIFIFGCSKNVDVSINNGITAIDFKTEMRNFVIGISKYSKLNHPNFAVIPQNGIELVTENGDISGKLSTSYLDAIDGNGQEDLLYGYISDDIATSGNDTNYIKSFLNVSKNAGNKILITDYCSTQSKISDSYTRNNLSGYVSFAANQRELNSIPNFPAKIYNENSTVISSLNQAQNFLYLINAAKYSSKNQFISAVTATNYDVLVMDLFFNDGTLFSTSEIAQLKNKANGGKRLVISYMSIGEAEDYRYYWNTNWNTSKPSWLDAENPNWAGNFKVKYWDKNWQNIIYGNNESYLKKILDVGFDGVYLDIIDAYEYYESK